MTLKLLWIKWSDNLYIWNFTFCLLLWNVSVYDCKICIYLEMNDLKQTITYLESSDALASNQKSTSMFIHTMDIMWKIEERETFINLCCIQDIILHSKCVQVPTTVLNFHLIHCRMIQIQGSSLTMKDHINHSVLEYKVTEHFKVNFLLKFQWNISNSRSRWKYLNTTFRINVT